MWQSRIDHPALQCSHRSSKGNAITGSEGGTPEKPVGTVVIGAFGQKGGLVKAFRFEGDRQAVRRQAVAAALELGLRLVGG